MKVKLEGPTIVETLFRFTKVRTNLEAHSLVRYRDCLEKALSERELEEYYNGHLENEEKAKRNNKSFGRFRKSSLIRIFQTKWRLKKGAFLLNKYSTLNRITMIERKFFKDLHLKVETCYHLFDSFPTKTKKNLKL